MNNYIFAVDDNGHSHHKLAYMQDGKILTLKVPSIVGDGSSPITDTLGVPQDTYRVNGRQFCCNTQIQSFIDLRNEGYQASDENKALLAHTIVQAGLKDRDIVLGVTLPWREAYSSDGKPNTERLNAVANHYSTGELVDLTDEKNIRILTSKPYSEGLSAFFDWAIDDNGSLDKANNLQGPVAVIDIGGSTTDITTVLGGSRLSLDHSRSNTKKVGVLDAKQQVMKVLSNSIREKTGKNPDTDGGIPSWMIQQAFETGKVQLGASGEIDITVEVESICKSVATQIISFVKSTVGNPLSYQAMVFVGGGAIVFQKALLNEYPQAFFSDEFANARGALKYMLRIDRNNLLSTIQGNAA